MHTYNTRSKTKTLTEIEAAKILILLKYGSTTVYYENNYGDYVQQLPYCE